MSDISQSANRHCARPYNRGRATILVSHFDRKQLILVPWKHAEWPIILFYALLRRRLTINTTHTHTHIRRRQFCVAHMFGIRTFSSLNMWRSSVCVDMHYTQLSVLVCEKLCANSFNIYRIWFCLVTTIMRVERACQPRGSRRFEFCGNVA